MSSAGYGMAHLMRAELRKITSTRLWWGLLVGAAVFSAITAVATAAFAGVDPGAGQPATPGLDDPSTIRSVYPYAAFGGAYVFALVLGVTGMTGEYRYQTITPTFLLSPRRGRVVAAKLAAHFGVGVLFGLVCLVVAFAAGGVVVALRGHDLGYGADLLWVTSALAVLAVGIWALVGVGIGTLLRNQVAAIMVAILVTFLVEPLLTVAFSALGWEAAGKFLPTNASSALIQPDDTFVAYLDWWAGGLVLLGYAVVFAGAGVLLSTRRDVT